MNNWFKNNEGQVRSGWKIALAFGLMAIMTGFFSFIFILVLIFFEGTTSLDELMKNQNTNVLMMLSQLLAVVGTITIFLAIEKRKWKDIGMTSLRNQGSHLLFGLFLGAVSIVFIALIMMATRQITIEPVKVTSQLLTEIGLYFIGFIFVAINEELFFRGYIVSTLKQTKSIPIMYIISSIIFGLAHIANPNVHLLGIVNIFLIGLLFAYMFIQTKSLWMTIGYHFTWNFFQGNILGFNVSGGDGNGFFHIKSADNIWTGGSFGIEGSIWTTVFIVLGFLITKFYIGKFDASPSHDQRA
jgi:membrane protease YdiL (CAAX protease family)